MGKIKPRVDRLTGIERFARSQDKGDLMVKAINVWSEPLQKADRAMLARINRVTAQAIGEHTLMSPVEHKRVGTLRHDTEVKITEYRRVSSRRWCHIVYDPGDENAPPFDQLEAVKGWVLSIYLEIFGAADAREGK